MATTTVTRPAVVPQPRQILRQGIIVVALLVIGVGLGMLTDSGRTGSGEAAGLTQGQQASADRLAAQAAALDNTPGLNAAAERLQGLADSIITTADIPSLAPVDLTGVFYDPQTSRAAFGGVPIEGHYSPELSTWIFGPTVAAAEHGAFTPMAYRDPAVVQQRFVGGDANLDPDVRSIAGLGEHGAFTPMAYRDPTAAQQRFVGIDADLDPDVATAPALAYDPVTSSLVPAGDPAGSFYDPESSSWVE